MSKGRRGEEACGPIERQRRFEPAMVSAAAAGGSSIRPSSNARTGTSPLKTASGTNDNENTFLWINSCARRSVEARISLSDSGSIDEDWDIVYTERSLLPLR